MRGGIADNSTVLSVDNTVGHTVGAGDIFIFDKSGFDCIAVAESGRVVDVGLIAVESVGDITVVIAVGQTFGGVCVAALVFVAV